jgi:outer membrane receptor protein involved in Fe transport
VKLFIIVLLLFVPLCYPQDLKISGVVRDANTYEALPYANLSFENELIGTSANYNGEYVINLPRGEYKLLASYIGYKTETVLIKLSDKNFQLDINLIPIGVILQEISVYSSGGAANTEISSASLQSKEMEKISSVFPDVFRSIQSLPGISVNNEFSAKFNVRGGNFDENLVLVNGTQVYEPFHIKEADNASVGIFNMDLMKKVNLITGGFSAQYGDRLSSVLNIEYREGNQERLSGAATLSLVNLDAVFEGPLTSRANFLIGIRKSYFEYVLSLLDVDEDNKPSFYDVQGVVTYNLSDINKLQFKFIHAGDDFIFDPAARISGPFSYRGNFLNQPSDVYENQRRYERQDANYYSNLFDLQNKTFLSDNALLNMSISYYQQIDREKELETNDYDFSAANSNYYFYKSQLRNEYNYDLTIETLEGKSSFDYRLNPFYDMKLGLSYLHIDYSEDLNARDIRNIIQNIDEFPDTLLSNLDEYTEQQNIKASSHKLYGYFENILQLGENAIINIGGRIDYFDFNRDLNFSPRISASYRFENGINLRAAWGYFYQAPIYRQLAYSVPSDTNTQAQKAEHFIISIEKSFFVDQNSSESLTIKAESYYKKYSDLISSQRGPYGNITYSRMNDSKGYATGIDFYASLRLSFYYGWISYGLLFAREDLLTDSKGEFPRYTDQKHTISFINDFNLGKSWNINLRFTYGSGFAYTPSYSRYNEETERYEWITGDKNSDYLPEYKRVDIRIGKEISLFNLPAFIFLDVNNLFDFDNVNGFVYSFNKINPVIKPVELWPVIPSLGLTVKF